MPVAAMTIGKSDEVAAFLSQVDRGGRERRGLAFLFTRMDALPRRKG